MVEYYVDTAQGDELKKLDKALKAGKLDHVKDTAEYWKRYTTVELNYIMEYKKNVRSKKFN